MAVTTSPCPRLLSTPNADIGATGWSTITPYIMRSHSVSERFSRGAEPALFSLSKPISSWRQIYAAFGHHNLNRFKSDNSAHSRPLLQQQKFCAPFAAFADTHRQFLTCSFGQVLKSTASVVSLTPLLILAQLAPGLCSLF